MPDNIERARILVLISLSVVSAKIRHEPRIHFAARLKLFCPEVHSLFRRPNYSTIVGDTPKVSL